MFKLILILFSGYMASASFFEILYNYFNLNIFIINVLNSISILYEEKYGKLDRGEIEDILLILKIMKKYADTERGVLGCVVFFLPKVAILIMCFIYRMTIIY